MELTKVIYEKVLTRPVTYNKNTFYLIKADGDDYVDYVITGDDSLPYDLISTERIESLILPYDDSTLPTNGQVLIFDGTNFVPDDAPETVPQAVLDHITRTDNPHNVQATQVTDFDVEVANNTAVAANTAKVSNVDHPLVETAVPVGAVFTDTIYNDTAIQAEVTANTAKLTANTANVTAAGALMDSEITNLTQVKTFDTTDYATSTQGATADTALQPADIGTSAALDVPAVGDAAIGEVVKGDDTRLTDARTPTAHTHVKADITDFAEGDYEALLEMTSSGIHHGGLVTINADPTKFDISAGSGWVVAHPPGAPSIVTEVTWGAFTAQSVTNLATSFATDIAIDISGSIVQQDSYTPVELRSLILLGGLDHSNQTSILNTFPIQRPTQSVASNVAELARAIGDVNLSGNNYGANGANLSIDKSGGIVYSYGKNNGINPDDPSTLTTSSQTALKFGYVYDNGSGGGTFTAPTTFIDPNNYDDGTGTLASIASNKFTIQRLLYFANASSTFVQYGTTVFTTLVKALDAVPRVSFPSLTGIKTAMVRGYIIVQQGETSLASANTTFLAADKFGNVAGLEAGSTTASWGNITGTLSAQTDLQSALDAKLTANTANVTAAGALMDSEVTNLTQVKAFDTTDYAPALGVDDNYVTDAEKIVVGNTSGINTGDQDISGITTNALNITTLQGEQTTQDSAIALNTAKVSFTDAPSDGSEYVRKDAAWAVASGGGGGGPTRSYLTVDVVASTTVLAPPELIITIPTGFRAVWNLQGRISSSVANDFSIQAFPIGFGMDFGDNSVRWDSGRGGGRVGGFGLSFASRGEGSEDTILMHGSTFVNSSGVDQFLEIRFSQRILSSSTVATLRAGTYMEVEFLPY